MDAGQPGPTAACRMLLLEETPVQLVGLLPVASSSQLSAACAGLQAVPCVPLCAVPGQHKVAWTLKSCHSSQ